MSFELRFEIREAFASLAVFVAPRAVSVEALESVEFVEPSESCDEA